MATISLCMIVKNEERVLARCLDSLVDLMDEIIIVDTGSTDSTKEIAAKYTDQIYDFPWIDDFAAARNFAGSKASMEYIYTADADEVLDEENRRKFADLKQVLLPEVELVQMYYCNILGDNNTTSNFEEELRPKLYRRLRSFTWIDPVHETLRLDPVVFDSEIRIRHCPEGNHASRDLSIFQRYCSQGNRLSAKLHHMYAMELFISGTDQEFEQALPFFQSAMSEAGRSPDEILEALCVLTHGCRIRGDAEVMLHYALKGVAMGGCSELCCELGAFYADKGEPEEAALWYENAIKHTGSILNIDCQDKLPREALEALEQLP